MPSHEILPEVMKYVVDVGAQGMQDPGNFLADIRSRGRSRRIRQSNGAIDLSRHAHCSHSLCPLFDLVVYSASLSTELSAASCCGLSIWIYHGSGLSIRFGGTPPNLLIADVVKGQCGVESLVGKYPDDPEKSTLCHKAVATWWLDSVLLSSRDRYA
jgi:hypothetical protein